MKISRIGSLPLLIVLGCLPGFDGLDVLGIVHAAGTADEPSEELPSEELPSEELPAALTLMQLEPSDGALDVPIDGSVRLSFSCSLDPTSVWAGALALHRSGSPFPALGSIAVDGNVVTFTPLGSLVLGNAYTLRFEGSLGCVDGAEWSGAIETHFQTRDGSWCSPESVGDASADTPELAVDAPGNALLLWQLPSSEGQAAQVRAARFTPGQHWQALPISVSAGPYARPARVVAGDDGVFALVWLGIGSAEAALYHLGDDHFLGTPVRLGPSRIFSAATDALFASGRAWVATSSGGAFLQAYHSEGAAFWRTPKSLVQSDDGSRAAGPVLIADGLGQARAFWTHSDTLLVATVDYSGDWDTPAAIASLDPSHSVDSFSGAGSDYGDALLAWEDTSRDSSDAVTSRLQLLLLDSGGTSAEDRPDSVDAGGNAYSPAVEMSAEGDAVLTWVASPAGPDDADAPARAWAASRLADSPAWSAPLALSGAEGVRARPPVLGLDPSGNGHAAWVEVDATGTARLVATRFTRAAGWSAATQVISAATPVSPQHSRSLTATNKQDPRIVVDAHGRALAVWVGPDGGL
ncbi:MAG: Ig-like domain-containing protein, partial [Deltaproteobacteria bacterium]